MKILLRITGIIVLIIVLAVLLIPFAFKGKISEAVLSKANQNVNAEISYGSFRLSLIKSFPDFNASFNDVAVVGIDDFEGDTLLAFKNLSAQIDVRSVFSGDGMLVKSLHIDKALLQLIQNDSGNVNWSLSKAGATETKEKNENNKEPLKLQLSEIVITDFDFIYSSKKYNYLFSTLNIDGNLSGDVEGMNALFDVEATTPSINFNYDSVRYISNGELNLSTQLDANLENYEFVFRSGKTGINGMPVDIDGGFSMPGDSMLFDIDFKVPEIDILQVLSLIPDAFQKYMKGIEATGNVEFGGKVKGVYYEDIYPGMDIGLNVNNATIKYPGLPDKLDLQRLIARVAKPEGDFDLLTLGVEKMDMTLADNPFSMQAVFGTLMSDPFIDVDLNGTIDLGSLSKVIPLGDTKITGILKADAQMTGNYSSLEKNDFASFVSSGMIDLDNFFIQNSSVPQGVRLSHASVELSDQDVTMHNLTGAIGQSDFKAEGKLSNVVTWLFGDDELYGNMNLNSELLNLNEFMANYTPDKQPGEEDYVKTDSISQDSIPLTLPDKMNLVFDADVNHLLYDQMDITDFKGKLVLHDQQLDLQGLSMNLIGGSMTMNGVVVADGRQNPDLTASLDISGFDLPTAYQQLGIVQKYMPFAAKSQGQFSTDIKLQAPLSSEMKTILSDVTASGSFSTNDVKLLNTRLFSKLDKVVQTNKFRNVEVDNFTTSYSIENGNLNVAPLSTRIAGQAVQLSGAYNLGGTLDFRVDARVDKDVLSSDIQNVIAYIPGHQKVKTIDVGFSIKGDAKKPDVDVDTDKIRKQVLNQVKNSSREELEDAAKNLLRDLFK
jgi:hypothetical protein